MAKINSKLEKNLYLGHLQIIFLDKKFFNEQLLFKKIICELQNNTDINSKTKLIFLSHPKKFLAQHFEPQFLEFVKNKYDKKVLTINNLWASFHEAL